MICESDFLTLASIAWFKAIVVIAACLACFVKNTENHFSDLKPLYQRSERFSSVVLNEGVEDFS